MDDIPEGQMGVFREDLKGHIMSGEHWRTMADVMRDMQGFGFKDARNWGSLKIMGPDGLWIDLYQGVSNVL